MIDLYRRALREVMHHVRNLARLLRDRHETYNGSMPLMPAYRRKLARIAVNNLRRSLRVIRALVLVQG